MTTATEEPEAPPLTEELQRKIIRLNDECIAALHEFEVKNDEARAAHKDYKEKCKRLHEVISSTRVSLPLFDAPPGVNGHAQVGAEAAREEGVDAADTPEDSTDTGEKHAFRADRWNDATPAEADLTTELESILTAAGLSEDVVATLRSFNLNTIEQLEHYCQESGYDDPLAQMDGIGQRKAQQIMKAVGEHKRQAETAAATELPTDSKPSTETPKRRRGRPRKDRSS